MTAGSRGNIIRSMGKTFERIRGPVYVLGPQQRVEYLNQAALDWIGPESERLLGFDTSSTDQEPDQDLKLLHTSLQAPSLLKTGQALTRSVKPAQTVAVAKYVLFISLDADDDCVLAIADCKSTEMLGTAIIDANAIGRQLDLTRQRYPRLTKLGPLAGTSSFADRCRRQVSLAANSTANVFLAGEPGCGSRDVALAIHCDSGTNKAAITEIDCSLMDAELLESAMSSTIARAADSRIVKSTVLLRDVDLLARDAQDRIVQYLQEFGQGIRFISLSNNSVTDCIASKSLREDLVNPLATIEISIPSLAGRITDLPNIVHYIIEQRSSSSSRLSGISRSSLDLICTYPWPGGYEELDSAIRHAVSDCRDTSIQPDNLPLVVRSYEPQSPEVVRNERPLELDRFLQRIERELIDRAIKQSDGNRAAAARKLGISRSRLLRRIDENTAKGSED